MNAGNEKNSVRIPWWRTELGEEEIAGVTQAIRTRHINPGPECRALEESLGEALGVPYVVLTTSGSVALLLAMLGCGIGAGDEVIMPVVGFIAAAHAVMLAGGRVRFVDVRPERPLIDVEHVAAAITERTKAVVVMHLNGAAADVAGVRALCEGRGIAVIEDAAQAFGSRTGEGWLGTLGDVGAYSMGITKLLTTGEGGFVVTRSRQLYERLVKLRNHGTVAIAHNVFQEFGLNFRFTDLQASVGLAQLKKREQKIAGVCRVYEFYRQRLAGMRGVSLLEVRVAEGEVPLWSEVMCAERDVVQRQLRARGIETKAFHPLLSESRHVGCPGAYPIGARYAAGGLTLPSGPDQRTEDLETVVEALREALAERAYVKEALN